MQVRQADALILDVVDLHEKDRIVAFLTAEFGQKRGVARSARTKFSRFAGQLQSGVTPGAGFSMGANFVGNFGGESPFADAASQQGHGHDNGSGEVIDVEVVVDAHPTNDGSSDRSLMRQ